MVRQLTTVAAAFLLLLSFNAVSAQGATPQEYADWLVRASEADFAFLKGAHQNGYFVAVFAVGEHKMAVCYRDLNVQLNRVEVQLSLLDEHGEDLIVFGGNHRVLRRTFSKADAKKRIQWHEVYGTVYELESESPTIVRVVLEAKAAEAENFTTVFDDMVIRLKKK